MTWGISRQIEPIALVFADSRYPKIIRTVRDATEALIRYWPADDGEEFYGAVKMCVDVIVGAAEPGSLQQAMIRAAEEAGIPAISVVHQHAG
jgi:hypothetical protein